METHTIGVPHLDKGSDQAFTWMVHLADMGCARRDDPEFEEIWELAFTPGGLEVAYGRAYALRASRLRDQGKFVSPNTVDLERNAPPTSRRARKS